MYYRMCLVVMLLISYSFLCFLIKKLDLLHENYRLINKSKKICFLICFSLRLRIKYNC